MGFFDKLFGTNKNTEENEISSVKVKMGRYSDNNKTPLKTQKWYDAEDLFKEKKYNESLECFFDYLRDDKEDNVRLTNKGTGSYEFEIYQGSKIVKGNVNDKEVTAEVSLAQMEKVSVPVMRRLLELNYSLYYSRFALQNDKLCMIFDSTRDIASPNKLYYGLKELATKADKQDDLLVSDFNSLKSVDDSHVVQFSENEKEVKYKYFRFWIENTLSRIEELNQDSFSGGIAYMLLTLIYKIDFLIVPEGKLLNELEKINNLYWANKEEKTTVERNQLLKDSFQKLLLWEKSEVFKYFYTAKSTFAITVPKQHSVVTEAIDSAHENMIWYKENKYFDIGIRVLEYGISYCQYSYSLPSCVTDLFTLYMHINYSSFFEELGYKEKYYSNNQFSSQDIKNKIKSIMNNAMNKYKNLKFDTEALNFSSLLDFNITYLKQIAQFNFDNN